jgi:hypothetical protein
MVEFVIVTNDGLSTSMPPPCANPWLAWPVAEFPETRTWSSVNRPPPNRIPPPRSSMPPVIMRWRSCTSWNPKIRSVRPVPPPSSVALGAPARVRFRSTVKFPVQTPEICTVAPNGASASAAARSSWAQSTVIGAADTAAAGSSGPASDPVPSHATVRSNARRRCMVPSLVTV